MTSRPVALRPVAPSDDGFLLDLYRTTRDDVDLVDWPEEQKRAFTDQQAGAQRADYEARFPAAEHRIVEVDGEPHGRIWVDRSDEEIRLLDIALMPEHRGQGTGSVLLRRLMAEARETGRPLRHSVLKTNVDALAFYETLGFRAVEDFEVYVLMEWT